MLPLFPEATDFDRAKLAATLGLLAGENIYIGGSSWKYEGWIGQIYSRERYMVRGRFSQKRFEQECLAEYAETFPIVCGDFSFYQFPSDDFWKKLFDSAPERLLFAFKVPEEVTVKTFPNHPRYGPRAGEPNPMFLNPVLFEAAFLEPLARYRNRIAVLILEFGTFSKKSYESPEPFFADLDAFLSKLPSGWKLAVELRNEEFLEARYFEVLRKNGVAHVFNSWTRMPPLYKQIEIANAWTGSFTVVRGLLRTGRTYEEAVQMFSPYERVQDDNPKVREAVRKVIETSRKRKQPAYLFINNRLEGNAPVTIDAIVHDGMSQDED